MIEFLLATVCAISHPYFSVWIDKEPEIANCLNITQDSGAFLCYRKINDVFPEITCEVIVPSGLYNPGVFAWEL